MPISSARLSEAHSTDVAAEGSQVHMALVVHNQTRALPEGFPADAVTTTTIVIGLGVDAHELNLKPVGRLIVDSEPLIRVAWHSLEPIVIFPVCHVWRPFGNERCHIIVFLSDSHELWVVTVFLNLVDFVVSGWGARGKIIWEVLVPVSHERRACRTVGEIRFSHNKIFGPLEALFQTLLGGHLRKSWPVGCWPELRQADVRMTLDLCWQGRLWLRFRCDGQSHLFTLLPLQLCNRLKEEGRLAGLEEKFLQELTFSFTLWKVLGLARAFRIHHHRQETVFKIIILHLTNSFPFKDPLSHFWGQFNICILHRR